MSALIFLYLPLFIKNLLRGFDKNITDANKHVKILVRVDINLLL